MSNVEFDTDIQGNPLYSSKTGSNPSAGSVGMAKWLIEHGWADGSSGAQALLIGIVVVNFVIAGLILYFFNPIQ